MTEEKPEFDRYALFEDALWMVPVFAAKAHQKVPHVADDQELKACLREQLWNACLRFDPTKMVKFTTFAYWRMSGAVSDYLARCARNSRNLKLREPSWLENASVETTIVSPEDAAVRRRRMRQVHDYLEGVASEFSRKIILEHYFGGVSLRALSRTHRCSYARVYTAYSQTLESLRRHVGATM